MSAEQQTRNLDGQVAIVTGAAINTGRSIARMLSGAGAAVVVNYLTSADAAAHYVEGRGKIDKRDLDGRRLSSISRNKR